MPRTLTEDSLDFARRHIVDYYDTDFFPKSPDFEALWHGWDALKAELISLSLEELHESTPSVLVWPKPRGAYRIVHQPAPIDAVIYTALAYLACDDIEQARFPEGAGVACSYRLHRDDSGFFGRGSGFEIYRERCERLSNHHPYVLLADISDFYNQLYIHRAQNAVATATRNPALATAVEKHLSLMNSKASQGVPVGPAASIVFSEAAVSDCDELIRNSGFDHVRYVDDFRVFANSQRELERLLQVLSLYLYENHRLSLASHKTKISLSSDFIKKELVNQYQLTKLEILREIEVVNPYTLHSETVALEDLPEDAGELLADAVKRIAAFGELDMSVARAVIRRARANDLREVSLPLLENFSFFRPVVNDLALYLHRVIDEEHAETLRPVLGDMCEKGMFEGKSDRLWMGWLFSLNASLLTEPRIATFVYEGSSLVAQASAALIQKQLAWIRSHKTALMHHAGADRRALVRTTALMSDDERKALLKPLLRSGAVTRTDKVLIQWVLDGAPPADPNFWMKGDLDSGSDDIPF